MPVSLELISLELISLELISLELISLELISLEPPSWAWTGLPASAATVSPVC
jgi:hypothetical protein